MAAEIILSSLRRADDKIATHKPDALISIGKGDLTHCTPIEHTLRLDFADATPNSQRHRKRIPREDDICRIIDFACQHHQGVMLIHCQAGKSRSTAASLICQAIWGMSERDAVKWLMRVHPKAKPNGWMLGLCDSIRDSRLFYTASEAGIVKW